MSKRVVRHRIIERQRLFQMRSGRSKLARQQQIPTGGIVSQNEPGRIVTLTAQTQQILVQAQRQIELTTVHVIARLPKGDLKVIRRGPQLLP